MARPVTISDEVILDAAREIFLAHGIKATTALVAERAGVSEGIIFKRFKTKAELFRTAMLLGDGAALWAILERAGRGEIREQLQAIGREMISVYYRVIPIVMMSWSNAEEIGVPRAGDGEAMPIRSIRVISAYFEKEIALGRIPARAPEIYARTFIAAMWHFVMLDVTIPKENASLLSSEEFLDGVIDLLLGGAPRAATAAAGSGRRRVSGAPAVKKRRSKNKR
jgi:AcrR family transcriptional regulator